MTPLFATPYLRLQRLLVEARHARGLTQSEVASRLQVPQSFVSKYERGERRLDIVELLRILRILELDARQVLNRIAESEGPSALPSILDIWKVTPGVLTNIVNQNPSLRGMLLGYVAEYKLQEMLLSEEAIEYIGKPDDHDRTSKGDHIIEYQGQRFVIESKSLQSRMVEKDGDTWRGKAQVDASDRRSIVLEDGTQIDTTLLMVGEFDVLAVNCFAFEQEWNFVFGRNSDLPRSRYRGYSQ
ncbi:MAG: helix-turn-helix transcriptional regulator, partial [Dehalococcoidia bacterium]|nr:helix-turn-helix transcriptional regulator [Dehalococcoidia bacterium]